MSEPNGFELIGMVIEQIEKIDRGDYKLTDEQRDMYISKLLKLAEQIQKDLDPIVRETYRDDPAKLAEWDEIMHMCDDVPEIDAKPDSETPESLSSSSPDN